jgi:hypothetical protein
MENDNNLESSNLAAINCIPIGIFLDDLYNGSEIAGMPTIFA